MQRLRVTTGKVEGGVYVQRSKPLNQPGPYSPHIGHVGQCQQSLLSGGVCEVDYPSGSPILLGSPIRQLGQGLGGTGPDTDGQSSFCLEI